MEITRPKKRDAKKWSQNQREIKAFLDGKKQSKWTFAQYCQYSIWFLEVDHSQFINKNNKQRIEYLTSPPLISEENNQANNETKLEQEQVSKILRVITYAWSSIINLIEGKQKNQSNSLGIYTDQNINLHIARLQEILKELKGKHYRCALYIKENSYAREIAEKEISQEIVFVKLLQNILRTQTKKIVDVRTNSKPVERKQDDNAEEQIQQKETLANIREVVKVKEYFDQKFSKPNPQAVTSKDPIDLQNQQRRFNAAVIRFHMQGSQRR